MAKRFSQVGSKSAAQAIAAGEKVPAGWYTSAEDPSLAQYWDGSTWLTDTRSFDSLVNANVQEVLNRLYKHSESQAKALSSIQTNTTILAFLAVISAVGSLIVGIYVGSVLSNLSSAIGG